MCFVGMRRQGRFGGILARVSPFWGSLCRSKIGFNMLFHITRACWWLKLCGGHGAGGINGFLSRTLDHCITSCDRYWLMFRTGHGGLPSVFRILQRLNQQGTYRENDTIMRIKDMLSWSWKVQIEHVPKEKNNVADCLARNASRDGSPRHIWCLPHLLWLKRSLRTLIFSFLFFTFPLVTKKKLNHCRHYFDKKNPVNKILYFK